MIGHIDNVLLWIEDTETKEVMIISVKSAYRYLHSGKNGKQIVGKCGTGFTYQILTHMIKQEPHRYNVVVDNGERFGFTHMPVTPRDFILFLHRIDNRDIEYTEKQLNELQKTVEYDQDHGLKTNFTSSMFGSRYPEECLV